MKEELINKKVEDNYTFVQKNKICAKIYVQILVPFCHILIIANKIFQF